MKVCANVSDKQAVDLLREAANLLDAANAKIQQVYEASESLYEMHNTLEDYCVQLEMEADELERLV